MNVFSKKFDNVSHKPVLGIKDLLKYIGPGLLVTVGFIDPGNWAANLAAGADYGYALLWMITLATIMLIVLQHNVARLGITTGLCLSEATTKYLKPVYSKIILFTAMLASVSTSLAELIGGAIALNMLFDIPLIVGAFLVLIFVLIMLYTNTYRLIERWIIAFVSIIGIGFIYEIFLADVNFAQAAYSWTVPSFPAGSIVIIMSVLGAVVMPHNLFLHSEVIQSRQWNLKDDSVMKKQMKFAFMDTLFSMGIGWAINSAMILLAAATFFKSGISITDLSQAKLLLSPLLGENAGIVFAITLLLAGLASTITSGIAAGSIFAGIFKEPYDIKDNHSRFGVGISLIVAFLILCAVSIFSTPFKGLIYSQMILSMQLPITIFLQIYLTSSSRVMGKYKNTGITKILLYVIGGIVAGLNVVLLLSFFGVQVF
ncbi:Nramp family divalent metal transporter [Candidatus Gracilibacteria bacterium]|nr:Nramp family divalent metal transporter [Candidatus Gracilibacteria bacterium]